MAAMKRLLKQPALDLHAQTPDGATALTLATDPAARTLLQSAGLPAEHASALRR